MLKGNIGIFCSWCKSRQSAHITRTISVNTVESREYGTEEIGKYEVKIHRHKKGNKLCKGSDKTVTYEDR